MLFEEWYLSASKLLLIGLGLIAEGQGSYAADGVAFNTSRIILNSEEPNVATLIVNSTDHAVLVRASVTNSRANADSLPPFIVMPALFRLSAGSEQVIHVIGTPGTLPADRESLFYLRTLETTIPDEGILEGLDKLERVERKIFFYRPQHLGSVPAEAPKHLLWSLVTHGDTRYLRVTNSSPYHIAFVVLRVEDGYFLQDLRPQHEFVAPSANREFRLSAHIRGALVGVVFSVVDDKGRSTDFFRSEAKF